MPNKDIPDLNPDVSPKTNDLFYVAKRRSQGGYVDRKAFISALKIFSNTSRTMPKAGDHSVSASECDDRWFSNRNAIGTSVFSLPAAQEGLKVGFIVEQGYAITVDPQVTDKIVPDGGTDGVAVTCSTLGGSIFLRGYSDGWHVLSKVGTWTIV